MGSFFVVFNILANTALTVLAALGIYSFSDSFLWAGVGALAITGSATANPIFSLLAYPAVEFFFNDAGLTIYSALIVALTVVQMGVVFLVASKNSP